MEPEENNEISDVLEAAMAEARDGDPSSAELRKMITALLRKQDALCTEIEALEPDSPEVAKLEREIKETERQIAVLREETSIAQFVEESVRMAHGAQRLQQ